MNSVNGFGVSFEVARFIHGEAIFDEDAMDAIDAFEAFRGHRNELNHMDTTATDLPGSSTDRLVQPLSFSGLNFSNFEEPRVEPRLSIRSFGDSITHVTYEQPDMSDDEANFADLETSISGQDQEHYVTDFSGISSLLSKEIESQETQVEETSDSQGDSTISSSTTLFWSW